MILDDAFQGNQETILVEASKGKRLVNHLVDSVILQFISYSISFAAGTNDDITNPLSATLLWFAIFIAYFTIFEHFNNGITVGKMLTRTQVVTNEGRRPTAENILGRSFARAIPFDALSYLGDRKTGWHDRLSKTIVIDIDQSERPHEEYL